MNRRDLLKGIAGICATGIAPAFIGSSILMPTRKQWFVYPPEDSGLKSGVFGRIDGMEIYESPSVILAMPHGIIAGFTQRALKMSVVQNPHEWPRWPE